ncbi:MAG TPA: hypothetical protein VJ714_07095 [Anaerolineae bacterium]|nr:hypothetical protein [Anaerolineae bacterium]
MTEIWKRASIAVAVVLVLTACGGEGGQEPTPQPISLEYDNSAGVLIVEVDTYGGLLPPPSSRHIAEVSVYGDGQVVLAEEDGAPRVGTDRAITTGRVGKQELAELLSFIADSGFFGLDERYVDPAAPTDGPWRHVTVELLGISRSVSIYPSDYAGAPAAFWQTYDAVTDLQPSNATAFAATSGTLTAKDLGPIDDLPAGQGNQVAPWDTPLVGIALSEATDGAHLEGDQYRSVEQFLMRYPQGQLFGSQEGTAYQILLEANLPWEAESTE